MPLAGQSRGSSLHELAFVFLKLGTIGFGGPAAHIAMMEDEVVRRRGWVTREKFLDLVAATNLIPGPNSTEMAIHLGYLRAGWAGLVVAGAAFILPAVLMVTALAWGYVKYAALPELNGVLYGVKPVIVAVLAQALWRLGRTAVKTWVLAAVGAAAVVVTVLGVNELIVLLASGIVMMAVRGARQRAGAVVGLLPGAFASSAAAVFGMWPLFLFFLKVGSVLFGSGYVLLAFLRADLVERWGWLTEQQLLDAVAVGQVTPGPVFTTATFIGYVLGGGTGAAVATVGIFLPAFVFVALSGPMVPRLRKSVAASAFLDGVVAGSLALIAVVSAQLARAAVVDWTTVTLAVASAVALLRYRVNSAWVVAGGAVVGLFVK